MVAGQIGLGLAHLGHPQVGEAELGRQVGLDVPAEQGLARVMFVHSVNPFPHHASFSGTGWNWGR